MDGPTATTRLAQRESAFERPLASASGAVPAAGWLRATGITKRYGSRTVVDGVDIAVARGSFVVLAGRNGAGKSTLLSCLAGSIQHEGSVQLGGRPVGRDTRGRVSYLPQRLRLPGALTGREVLRLFDSIGRSDGPAIDPVPEDFLPPLDTPVGTLSGGQAQRVALAAALTGRPDLVLLDEPFANLDDQGREAARSALQRACEAGTTIMVASPTALDLLSVAERVVLIEDGRITFDGSPTVYAGHLEIIVWVRSDDLAPGWLEGIPHVLSVRDEGGWTLLRCHEDRSAEVLHHLEAQGVGMDRIRLGGPTSDARLSASPTGHEEARA